MSANPYLDRLLAREKTEKSHPRDPTKLTKPGSVSCVGSRSTPFFKFSPVFEVLESHCPDLIQEADWRLAVEDGRRFLSQWGEQAGVLGWTAKDLFGLEPVPDRPHPSYRRLSRYDMTGLVWLLRGRPVVALTANTAAIQSSTAAVLVYRKHNKPTLGPLGDSWTTLADGARTVRPPPHPTTRPLAHRGGNVCRHLAVQVRRDGGRRPNAWSAAH